MKQELINNLKKDISELFEKHSNEIMKDNIGQAFNIMKDIDVALSQLKTLANIDEEFDTDKQTENNDWYNVLKFFIETKQKQLIYLDYSCKEEQIKHRGTGKTTAILKLANDYNIPIFTDNYNSYCKLLKEKAEQMKLNVTIVDNKMLNLPQFNDTELLLVDENTNLDNISLRGTNAFKKFIGFKNNLRTQ